MRFVLIWLIILINFLDLMVNDYCNILIKYTKENRCINSILHETILNKYGDIPLCCNHRSDQFEDKCDNELLKETLCEYKTNFLYSSQESSVHCSNSCNNYYIFEQKFNIINENLILINNSNIIAKDYCIYRACFTNWLWYTLAKVCLCANTSQILKSNTLLPSYF